LAHDARMLDVPVVHAITNDMVLLKDDFLARAIPVMQALGERGAIHVRSNLLPSPRLYAMTCRLLELHADTGCWCIVSDRLDIALAARAHGAQLTSRSMTVADARRIAPKLKLGASIHSPEEAVLAGQDGADWCIAGNVFETDSHPGLPGRNGIFISQVVARSDIPIIAIGGIQPDQIPSLLECGAYGIATIRGIWEAKNSEAAAIRYLSAYDGGHRERVGNTG
jgi:thiazole tautomerase (transcriptional regulator TenI)